MMFLPLPPLLLCTGCPAAGTAPKASADTAEDSLATDVARPRTDSVACEDGCTEYTCYFTEGQLDKETLRHVGALLSGELFTANLEG